MVQKIQISLVFLTPFANSVPFTEYITTCISLCIRCFFVALLLLRWSISPSFSPNRVVCQHAALNMARQQKTIPPLGTTRMRNWLFSLVSSPWCTADCNPHSHLKYYWIKWSYSVIKMLTRLLSLLFQQAHKKSDLISTNVAVLFKRAVKLTNTTGEPLLKERKKSQGRIYIAVTCPYLMILSLGWGREDVI